MTQGNTPWSRVPRALEARPRRCALAVLLLVLGVACEESPPAGSLRRNPELLPQAEALAAAALSRDRIIGEAREDGRSIESPEYDTVAVADSYLEPDDVVFVVRERSSVDVFPKFALSPHHTVNTFFDGVPALLSYCQLSGCARLYRRELDGQVASFKALLLLYNGSLVLRDSVTGSDWIQFHGECLAGSQEGKRLETLGVPERMVWRAAREIPDARVFRSPIPVDENRIFMAEMERSQLGSKALEQVASRDERLPAYERGIGVAVRSNAYFFRRSTLRSRGLVSHVLNGWSLLAVWDEAAQSARLFRRYLDGHALSFRRVDGRLVDDQTDSVWRLDGTCESGTFAGRRLIEPVWTESSWFAWSAFYPGTGADFPAS